MKTFATLSICAVLALLTGCVGGACDGLRDVSRPPVNAGTHPMIVIDAVDPGSGYTDTDPDGCITGRIFNVDPTRVQIRVYENGWPQPWPRSLTKPGKDGTWFCAIRKGEEFDVYLLADEGYLPGQGSPYYDYHVGSWRQLDSDSYSTY